ncbi:MAG: glucose 1-dehydrogenase [Pseudomonadota bacterium]
MPHLFDLKGKTAVVTGASSGLGAHFAKTLSEAGAAVALAARRKDRLDALANAINSSGGSALAVTMDVTDSESIQSAFDTVGSELAVPDIIINNSGLSRENWLVKMDEDDWDLVMDTNLKGVWRVAKAGANRLIAAGKPGSIINIASITALRVTQTAGAYGASKAAVDHLTRTMAVELSRYGIRVNAIAPGYFLTEINDSFFDTPEGDRMKKRIPMRRLGEMEELSGPLLLLASDAGSYMTGATIVVDGGHTQLPL